MKQIHEIYVIELWIETIILVQGILMVMTTVSAVARERPELDLNPDLCYASAVLYQLSYHLVEH